MIYLVFYSLVYFLICSFVYLFAHSNNYWTLLDLLHFTSFSFPQIHYFSAHLFLSSVPQFLYFVCFCLLVYLFIFFFVYSLFLKCWHVFLSLFSVSFLLLNVAISIINSSISNSCRPVRDVSLLIKDTMKAYFCWRHTLFSTTTLSRLFFLFLFTPVFFYLMFLMDVL